MTQRRPKDVTTSPFPPFSLTLRCQQTTKHTGTITAEVSTGPRPHMRRAVRFEYDAAQGTPITVESACYKWVAWVLEEDRRRRLYEVGTLAGPFNAPPAWPTAHNLLSDASEPYSVTEAGLV